MDKNHDATALTKEIVQAVINRAYPGMALFARDVNLPEELAQSYTPDLIIREKAFTDASNRFMGMATTHRYVILSNHMGDMSLFEPIYWGLHVAQKNSHFKVLGQHTHQGKTGIFLLHLPDDESWHLWQMIEFAMERQLYDTAVQRFTNKCPPRAGTDYQGVAGPLLLPVGDIRRRAVLAPGRRRRGKRGRSSKEW